MATKKKNNGLSTGEKAAIGVGVTAAALGALGGYFLYGSKNAEKNRQKVKSWSLRAKSEVLEAVEKAKKLTQEEYEAIIDDVSKGYKAAKSASARELAEFAEEMKGHWKALEKSGTKSAKKVGKKAVAAAKK